ncbi:uncharacterized protein LOC130625560 isoform X2 [Hydractinia symbiolongicarpus]|uniref:uncharacterized protein LOC130625560 isoform X2 n=1 Tax=Hydractinia symbiolongicarpus TaxID=13093 RepID=UPI00254C9FF7|nr:uncharacterized protein LOC130625560 isoform X2 [Hydractinia symbiolongicarpus]
MVKVFKHDEISHELQESFVEFIKTRKRLKSELLAIADYLENRKGSRIFILTALVIIGLAVAVSIYHSLPYMAFILFLFFLIALVFVVYSNSAIVGARLLTLKYLYNEKHAITLLEKELKGLVNIKTMTFAGKRETSIIRSGASVIANLLKLNKADDVTDTDFRSLPYIETAFEIIGFSVKCLTDDIISIGSKLITIHNNEIPKKVKFIRELAVQINVPDEEEFIRKFRSLREQSAN